MNEIINEWRYVMYPRVTDGRHLMKKIHEECASVYLSVYLTICLSVPMYQYVYLSGRVSVSVCQYVSMSVCLTVPVC